MLVLAMLTYGRAVAGTGEPAQTELGSARELLAKQPFRNLEAALEAVGESNLEDCVKLRNNRLLMAFRAQGKGAQTDGTAKEEQTTFGAYSSDNGVTWDAPFAMKEDGGKNIAIPGLGSLLELKSGALGYYYRTSDGREGWGGNLQWWRKSTDGGRTWSSPSLMISDPAEDRVRHGRGLAEQGASHHGRALVLESGRVVIPAANMMYGPIVPRQEDKDWNRPIGEGTKAYQWGLDHFGTLIYGFCYLSDDEGKNWRRSLTDVFIVLPGRYPVQPQARGGFFNFEETTAIVLRDGQVMMLGRSILGRPFVSFSKDGGDTFFQPVPLDLASPDAPAMLARIPSTGDILLIWNQTSVQENVKGYSRHRLSTAVSQDEGKNWGHFRNLESLDDVTRVAPPPLGAAQWDVQKPLDPINGLHGVGGPHYLQPTDRKRYLRAPGPLRAAYPSCRIVNDTVIVRYQLGSSPPDTVFPTRTRQRILPVSWFYGGKQAK
jgi:hypothetical protein